MMAPSVARASGDDIAPGSAGGATGYRVLMIAPTSFFADYGCHVRILEEARILQDLGCQVNICTYHSGDDVDGIEIHRTMSIPWRTGYVVGSSRHKIAFDVLLFFKCLGEMRRFRPHVIHAHLHEGALIGLVLSRLFGVPMVFDLQGSLTSEMVDHHFVSRDGAWYRGFRRLERYIDRHSSCIITSSQNAARQLVRDFGCREGKIAPVRDCVDTDVFRPRGDGAGRASWREAWGIPPDRTVVVYLGKLAEYQGTGHLLRAARQVCAEHPDAHFMIAGYPFVDEYRHLARELGIADHCTFTGRISYREEAPHLLAMTDIAVAPKLSETEGAGKLVNYMASGLPTVAYDGAVSREFLGEQGVFAQRGDVDSLAQCLSDLVAGPERRRSLGAALRERAVERFSWRAAGLTILGLYADLLDGRLPDVSGLLQRQRPGSEVLGREGR